MLPMWKPRYSVNNKVLDSQHKELFLLANKVHALDAHFFTKAKAKELIGEFYKYMKEHFEREEAHMQDISYPNIDQHKQFHNEIIEGMNKMLANSANIVQVREAIKKGVEVWLVEHILEHDLAYVNWEKQKNNQS